MFFTNLKGWTNQEIKAKTEQNEILWIFFGVHVGNALEIGRRKMVDLEKNQLNSSHSKNIIIDWDWYAFS